MPVRRPYLGDLEIAVLEHLWAAGEADAKSVHRALGKTRTISLSTIQSTLERLVRKLLLTRNKVSHAYVYSPLVDRRRLMTTIIDEVVQSFSAGDSEFMLAAFLDLADRSDPDNLDRLQRLIDERRAIADGDA